MIDYIIHEVNEISQQPMFQVQTSLVSRSRTLSMIDQQISMIKMSELEKLLIKK